MPSLWRLLLCPLPPRERARRRSKNFWWVRGLVA